MHPLIRKTFGGLTAQYYFRQLFFGLLMAGFAFFMSKHSSRPVPLAMLFFTIGSTLLYPYSRFVYESIMTFIIGNNVFFINTIIMLIFKTFTMAMCWSFALFVAPIGLVYLYFYHSRATY
jgi:hypothetical protein